MTSVAFADPIKPNLKMPGKKTDKRDAREIARRPFPVPAQEGSSEHISANSQTLTQNIFLP